MKVFISGQKYFGLCIYRLCKKLGCEIIGVCAPLGDKYLMDLATKDGVKNIVVGGGLDYHTMPDGVDLGIAAHSFDYVGKRTRLKTKLGWLGYHPSLLPRHRGRSAIEWAVRMRDSITGGSVFWLNAGIDRGDVFLQDFIFIDPKLYSQNSKKAAQILWQHHLLDMGVRLMEEAILSIQSGHIIKKPQDERFSTFEPSTDVKDMYRPDQLLLV